VEDTRIDDDHPLDSAEDARVGKNQTKPTVEYHRLTSDHDNPSPGVEDLPNPENSEVKILDHESQPVGDSAQGGYGQSPEIEAAPSVKGDEDEKQQLETIVEG
jgi:hypothetical protein